MNLKKRKVMKTAAKTIVGAVIGAAFFVCLGDIEGCTLTQFVVTKAVASGLLLFGIYCYRAISEW